MNKLSNPFSNPNKINFPNYKEAFQFNENDIEEDFSFEKDIDFISHVNPNNISNIGFFRIEDFQEDYFNNDKTMELIFSPQIKNKSNINTPHKNKLDKDESFFLSPIYNKPSKTPNNFSKNFTPKLNITENLFDFSPINKKIL
jgi:hypothetical protein